MALKRKFVQTAAEAALVNVKLIVTLKDSTKPIVLNASVDAKVYEKLETGEIKSISLAEGASYIAFEERASE